MKFLSILFFISSSLFFFSCGSEKQAPADEPVVAQEPEYFEGHGRIISIPPSKKNFIMKHGDIPGFMGGMTMAFPVKDSTVLDNVSPRDSVWFKLESIGRDTYVIEINKVE